MKKILACLLCVSALLPMSGTFAQNDAPTIPRSPRLPVAPDNPAPAHLDGNYLLTLTFTEKDQPGRELAVVVATPSFNTNSAQPIITLNGTLFPQEGGVYLVDYNLGLQAVFSNNGRPVTKDTPSAELQGVQYRSINTKSSVLLHLGEPVQIIKDGDQTYTLKIDRCKPATP